MNKILTLFFACLVAFAAVPLSAQEVEFPGWNKSAEAYIEYIEYAQSQEGIPQYYIDTARLCLKMIQNPPKTFQDVLDASKEEAYAYPHQWVYNYVFNMEDGMFDKQMLLDSVNYCLNVKEDYCFAPYYMHINKFLGFSNDQMFDILVKSFDKHPDNLDCVNMILNLIVKIDGRDAECLALLKKMNRVCSAKLTNPDLAKTYEPIVAKIRTLIPTY